MSIFSRRNGRGLSCPKVANLAARALICHGFNATRAAKEIRPYLTDQSAKKVGHRMMNNPVVQEEIERQLQPRGLDERSRDALVAVL